MVVFAANVTDETISIIKELLNTPEFINFGVQNKLTLTDNTVLIRLAIFNLIKNFPSSQLIKQNKAALVRPSEFDDFLKECVKEAK